MTGHNRPLPSGEKIARQLRRLFRAMRQRPTELGHWLPTMVEALEPVCLKYWSIGISASSDRTKVQLRKGLSYFSGKNPNNAIQKDRRRRRPSMLLDMDLFNPRILEAVKHEVFTFCQSTLDTLSGDVDRAIAQFRAELGEGLQEGETNKELTRRVRAIFDDPARAARIAQTEASRAVHGGQWLADKESGVVAKKLWQASGDACDLCLSLAARGPIPLDEPFYVNPKGGPYAVCIYPPVHPHDLCTYLSILR